MVLDLFGLGRVDATDAIKQMMHGAVSGLFDSFEYRLSEKERTITELSKKIEEQEDYKKKYEEALARVQSLELQMDDLKSKRFGKNDKN